MKELFLVILLLSMCSIAVASQTSSSRTTVIVRDKNGGAVPKAAVTITNYTGTAITSPQGEASFNISIPPQTLVYVVISASGYKPFGHSLRVTQENNIIANLEKKPFSPPEMILVQDNMSIRSGAKISIAVLDNDNLGKSLKSEVVVPEVQPNDIEGLSIYKNLIIYDDKFRAERSQNKGGTIKFRYRVVDKFKKTKWSPASIVTISAANSKDGEKNRVTPNPKITASPTAINISPYPLISYKEAQIWVVPKERADLSIVQCTNGSFGEVRRINKTTLGYKAREAIPFTQDKIFCVLADGSGTKINTSLLIYDKRPAAITHFILLVSTLDDDKDPTEEVEFSLYRNGTLLKMMTVGRGQRWADDSSLRPIEIELSSAIPVQQAGNFYLQITKDPDPYSGKRNGYGWHMSLAVQAIITGREAPLTVLRPTSAWFGESRKNTSLSAHQFIFTLPRSH